MEENKTAMKGVFPTGEDLAIPDFCDMAAFDKMMRDWSFATGLATVAVGKDGKYLTGYYNFTDFCEKLTRKSPEGLRRCIECDKKGHGTYLCHAGLVDFAAPITLEDGTVMGNIVGGQVLPVRPDEAHFRATARELGIPEDRYIEELRKVNIRSPEQIQASFDLLTAAITMFVRSSYQARLNNQSLIERTNIISSLGTLYFCDYFIDLTKRRYRELDSTPWAREMLKPFAALPPSEIAEKLLPYVVTPDFRKDFGAFVDFKTLGVRLQNRPSIAIEYISTNSGWCRAIFIPVKKDAEGYATQVIFAIQDINEEKLKELEIQEKLRHAAEEANDANKAKTDFLSRMSHDIRTPLNGIVGMTYLAEQEKNPEKTTDYLKKIDTSSKFLLGLINDILDMAKVESNKIVLHPEPYPVAEFNEYLDSVIRPLCQEKNIHFTSSIVMVPGWIPLMDKLRISQVVFNLLSNAVKFTPEGGKVDYSAVFKLKEKGKLELTAKVSDNGVGMSEDFQKIIFTPFSQESRSDIASNRGTGLGLAISKHMVDLMGGTILVSSILGKGTTFTFTIVFDAIPERPIPEEKFEAPLPAEYPALRNAHILLFEDHPLNQEIAKALLERKGAIVEVANNGVEGLKAFRLSSPFYYSAILMDIRMPIMDGYEATSALRSLKRADAKRIPIVAMTADAFEDDVKKCLAIGMNAHIAKPIDPTLLYATLEKGLEKK
jgi:signal transduction histidine kinase/ActR/RegA family two-component response regulator